jgi:hypothetical protein
VGQLSTWVLPEVLYGLCSYRGGGRRDGIVAVVQQL